MSSRYLNAGLTLALFGALTAHAQSSALSGEDEQLTVVRAGKVITVSGKEIDDGVIVISGGRIQNVGKGLEYPKNAKVIDARQRTVMPGLVNVRTRYGLPPGTRKGVHADFSVADECFPSAGFFDEFLRAGYTAVTYYPGGAEIPGRAIVVHTGGSAERQMILSPAYLRVSREKKPFRDALERAKKEIEKQEKAREEWDKKQKAAEEKKAAEDKQKAATQPTQPASRPATQPASQPVFEPPPIDPKVQALVDLLQKKPGVVAMLELSGASDAVQFFDVLERYDIAHVFAAMHMISTDYELVAKKLGEKTAKVTLLPLITHALATVDRRNLPLMFARAGCEVTLLPMMDNPREFGRVLIRTAELVREGWSREEALKALTLNPAKLLGLDARFGSIEKGKDADLIFLDADPFAPDARVREVMIGGEIVFRVTREAADAAYLSDGEAGR